MATPLGPPIKTAVNVPTGTGGSNTEIVARRRREGIFVIQDFRGAFLFFEASLDPFLLSPHQRRRVTPDRERWTRTFEALRGGEDEDLSVPWREPRDWEIWADYFEGERQGDIRGRRAWTLLTPLRSHNLAAAKPSIPFTGRARVEAFVYPHGIAVGVSFVATGALSLDDAVNLLASVRQTKFFVLSRPGDRNQRLRLEELAKVAIDEARARLLPRAPQSRIMWDPSPFSVVTVVQATGRPPAATDGSPLHHALHALSGSSGRLRGAKVERFLLHESDLAGKDLLYGRDRGRAVWFPQRFGPTSAGGGTDPHFLGNYHRHLVLTSLQTEALLGLTTGLGQRLRSGYGPTTPYWLRACARNAAGAIGRIYGGKVWPDRTASLRAQIEQANRGSFKVDVETVRDYFDMPGLHGPDDVQPARAAQAPR